MRSRQGFHQEMRMDGEAREAGAPQSAGEAAAGVALGTHEELIKAAADRTLANASKATRFVLKKTLDSR